MSFPSGFSVAGCEYGAIEIKAQADQRITGYRSDANMEVLSVVHILHMGKITGKTFVGSVLLKTSERNWSQNTTFFPLLRTIGTNP